MPKPRFQSASPRSCVAAPAERPSWAKNPWFEWSARLRDRSRHVATTALDQAGQCATTAQPGTGKEGDVKGGGEVEDESEAEFFDTLETMSPKR